MKLAPFNLHQPKTVEEAVEILGEHDEAKILAGGQSLLAVMALRLGSPEHLIDIGSIPSLVSIKQLPEEIEIGAMVTQTEAGSSELVAKLAPLVAKAIPSIAHRAVRNRGTVCGSLAHADPAAELPAVAACMGATIVAVSPRGRRTIDAVDFFSGFLTTDLADDELITAVRFPIWPSNAGCALVELNRRDGDFALVGVAVALHLSESGLIDDASIVFFSVGSKPIRATEAEDTLIGAEPTPESFARTSEAARAELEPTGDSHASSAYRKHTAGVVLRQALAESYQHLITSNPGAAQ